MALCANDLCHSSLVSVQVCLEIDFFLQLNSTIKQLLHHCKALQTMHLLDNAASQCAASVVLDKDHGTSLQKLFIENFCYDVLDFGQAVSLSTIELVDVSLRQQGSNSFDVNFPVTLHSLKTVGNVLSCVSNGLQLEHCCQLTRLTLSADLGMRCQPFKPVWSGSLRHLLIEAYNKDDWTEGFDWCCLSPCTNLERLTVPDGVYGAERRGALQLQAWISTARHLHVLDYAV